MGSPCLARGALKVVFHPRYPVVLRYHVERAVISGDTEPAEPTYLISAPDHDKNLGSLEAGLDSSAAIHREKDEVRYAVSLSRNGTPVVRFSLVFALGESDLSVMLRDVTEQAGYQLVSVDLKRLASASTRDPRSRVALPTNGGRRIDPARCRDGERLHRYNWVRDAYCQVGIVYGAHASVTLRLESLNDQMLSSVAERGGARDAAVGARIAHRVEARLPRLQFAVHSPSRVLVTLLATDRDDPLTGWIPAARSLREKVHNCLPDRYVGRFVYKVFVGKPGSPAEIPFDAVIEGVRRRFRLLDGAGQVCYLVGFQHEGHDSGYPDVFTANRAAGGMEALKRVMADAAMCNTTMSFHDNYDDAYRSSPSWDPRDIAVDPAGELLRGGVWNGEQAYWISLPKYVASKATARITRTLAQYPIHDTYHLDVLTASVFRPDFDPASPSDRNDDLAARKRLVELFRSQSIDVTSEGCGLPFLETFRYFWDLPRPSASVYEGDEAVPLTPFIAHGAVGYGGSESDRYGIVEGLLYGAFHSKDISFRTTEAEILDAYYLLHVPLNSLRDKAFVDYEESGASRKIAYEDGSVVEVDFSRLFHRVTVGGSVIVEDFISFAPGVRPGTFLLYVSLLGDMGTRQRHDRWPCPPQWRVAKGLRATELTPTGDGRTIVLPVGDDGTFPLDVCAGVPYRVLPDGG